MTAIKKQLAKARFGAMVVVASCVVVFVAAHAREQQSSPLAVHIDFDQDGLSNDEEALYGTDPDNPDTDGDGFSDGVEVRSGYDPLIHKDRGDRVIGLEEAQTQSDVSAARSLTNELRTRVAGIAFDVASGKEVTLGDIDKEVQAFVDNAVKDIAVPQIDMDRIRVKRQDYGDLSEEQRRERIKRDVANYTSALAYTLSLYTPKPLTDEGAAEAISADVLGEAERLMNDFTDVSPFIRLAEDSRMLQERLFEIEVPEVALPLHVEGLQFAAMVAAFANDAKGVDLARDPAEAAVLYARAASLTSIGAMFMEKVQAFAEEYGQDE